MSKENFRPIGLVELVINLINEMKKNEIRI